MVAKRLDVIKQLTIGVLCLGAIVGCVQAPVRAGVSAVYFVDQDPDLEPAHTRMIVTPKFLRIDDGQAGGDFLLYDRARRTIYNVSALDSLVLVIPPGTIEAKPPMALEHVVERMPNGDMPQIGGKSVSHYRLSTNRTLCYDLYAADGLLPDVVAALREYRSVLAAEQARTLRVTPKEMQTACDLADNIYAPARHLEHGFPVRLAETTGRTAGQTRTSELVDYKEDFAADPALFVLPALYRRMTIDELRQR